LYIERKREIVHKDREEKRNCTQRGKEKLYVEIERKREIVHRDREEKRDCT
jgi:hypothetical protein